MTKPEHLAIADKLRRASIDVQIVRGNAEVAEDSFFKINEQGVVISPTEKILCKHRTLATCIATRAILRGGTGNQYWKGFNAENQSIVIARAGEIHSLLFSPPHKDPPESAVMDCPLGGFPNAAMPMVYQLVVAVVRKSRLSVGKNGDIDGSETLLILNEVRKLIWLLNSKEAGSLGILPALYVYNSIGKYQPSAFLSLAMFFMDLRDRRQLIAFTTVRESFESYYAKYKVLISQFVRKYGSLDRPAGKLVEFFHMVLDGLIHGKSEEVITDELTSRFKFLNPEEDEFAKPKYRNFSKDVKTGRRLIDDIRACSKCAICNGYVYPLSRSIDHVKDKKLGGTAELENSASTHPYCNNSKDALLASGRMILH